MQEDNNLDITLSQEQEDKLKKLFAIDPNKQIADFQVPSTFNVEKITAAKKITLWAKYKRLISKVVEFLTK